MRHILHLTLLAMLAPLALATYAAAQSDRDNTPPMTHSVIAPGSLAGTPSAPPPEMAERPIRLPSTFQPAWAVDRSHLGEKLSYGFASLGSSRVLAESFLLTGIPNLPSAPSQPQAPSIVTIASADLYGDQMDDWGKQMDTWRRSSEDVMRYHEHRLEAGVATVETRMVLSNLALPIVLHQQARYRPAAIDATLDQRLANAAESILLTHSDRGQLVPNYSKLVGTVAAGFLGQTLYSKAFNAPEFNSSHFLVKYVGYSLSADLATNVAHELVRASIEQDVQVYNLHGRSVEDSYYPMSAGAKVIYWARSTYAARNFAQAILLAGLPSIGAQPVEPPKELVTSTQQALAYDQTYVNYGNAIQAWRRHLENNIRYHDHRLIGGLAASETQMALQNLAIPMLLGIDPRYIPLGRYTETGTRDAGARIAHAFKSLVEARTDSGGRTINLPVLAGTVGGALIAKQFYYPQLGAPALATNQVLAATIGVNLAFDLVGNLESEFFRHRGY